HCRLSAIVRAGENDVAAQVERLLFKPLEPPQNHFLDHFAASSFLTTSNSLPRGSITFTAIWPCSPAGNGALVVPAKWSQTVSSNSTRNAFFRFSQAPVRGKNACRTRKTMP